ncbi:MAG TPA: phosphotransferase family protein [Stellaceae bacterium]
MTPEAITAALSRLAPALTPGGATIDALSRLSTGASLETWSFLVRGPSGATRLVLRRRERGERGDGAFTNSIPLRDEAALLSAAAAAGVPVARLVRACQPEDGLGEAVIVSHVDGETRGRRLATDERFATIRPTLAAQCGRILARIHAMPVPATAALATYDAAAEIARYETIYHRLDGASPILELGFRMLTRRAPPCPNPVVLHGDFRNGNLMIDAAHGIVAVLDWELSHRGDPAEDLGWLCVNSWRFGAVERPVGGFGDYADLLGAYEAEAGRAVPFGAVLFWQAVGTLKWAVMCMMMVAAHRSGEAPSLERLMIGRRRSEAELDLVTLLEGLA